MLAFWLALPPVTARTPLVPVVVGGLGVLAGLSARRLGVSRRLAWGAVAVAALGIVLGWLATRSDVASLDQAFVWSALIAATLRAATPLTFAALGGIFSERSGVINIGLEGMMLMGAFFGFLGADKTGDWWWGIVTGVVAGAALALVHAFIAIHLRADQIVSGFAVNFLALGVTGYFFIEVYTDQGTPGDISTIPSVSLTWLGIPEDSFVDKTFGDRNLLIWVALVCVVIAPLRALPTPIGLRLRSVGEHPKAADTVGISVYAMRYGAVVLSGALAGMGGVYLSNGITHGFNGEHDRRARLHRARGGDLRTLAARRGVRRLSPVRFHRGAGAPPARRLREDAAWTTLFRALPYVVTLVVVAGVVGRSIPPAAVGRPYVKQ